VLEENYRNIMQRTPHETARTSSEGMKYRKRTNS